VTDTPLYMGSGDPARRRTHYYPAWLDNLADDVTLEASAMNGAVQGAKAVRSMVVTVRTLYEYQEFNFAGPYGDNGFLETAASMMRSTDGRFAPYPPAPALTSANAAQDRTAHWEGLGRAGWPVA
jgi:hypothetical protein